MPMLSSIGEGVVHWSPARWGCTGVSRAWRTAEPSWHSIKVRVCIMSSITMATPHPISKLHAYTPARPRPLYEAARSVQTGNRLRGSQRQRKMSPCLRNGYSGACA